jgi:ABC-type antimicrobial peptide transport system permease subunit
MVLPHRIMSSTSGAEWEGKGKEETFLVHYNIVNYDFIETFKIEMVEGRSFSEEFSDDTNYGFILNQEAIRQMGLDDPINKNYSIWGMEGKIVGVMKDFHFKSLHNPIEPMMFLVIKEYAETLVIRVNATDTENTISYLEDTMAKFDPEKQHKFRFFDERYEAMYKAEQQIEIILKIFTGLAIFVACLGLFGLSTFLTQQRFKEIGIRKVLGANIPNLVITLSKEFTKWIIMANLIACPLAYYLISKILQNFAYRVSMGTSVFVITIVLSILIAIITVSFQTIKVAYSNPVKALKYE